jgi:photosystem II stability/assembly factor-like uncharacterized protein
MPEANTKTATTAPPLRDALLQAAQWRNIGPFRGGRVVAVAGDPIRPLVFYMGSTGGGVWKTIDAGLSWTNVSDGYFKTASVGALAVAESDPNVIYAGMGETTIRGNVAHGDGVYRSTDAGKSWAHCGLAATRSIARVRIHPQNPDLVYVAALGHTWGPNPERGLYRSRDGGQTWDHILTRGDKAGAIDLALDPTNPRILYAAFWESGRTPWQMISGGPGSGLFKSVDGGDTWADLSDAPGLPQGVKGKIGLAVSPARPERIWALIEAEKGGFFRSDDGGAHWTKLNEERELLQRAWYYAHVIADPHDPDTVWAPNVRNWRSVDGGKSFAALPTPHGDNHDIWIDPRNPQRLIQGNDGGACVSFDGGNSWSTIYNQPTAEFYHVTTDARTPYRVYGAQQDNSTLSLPSRSDSGAITWAETYPIGGGESGYIAVRPDHPDVTYAGSYGGLLTRYDHRTRQARNIAVWPENPIGWTAGDQRYRFQWTFPIVISPHDPDTLYVCSNHVHRSGDEGGSWTTISPDLTRNDKGKMGSSGGPITQDNTSVEYYGTIFAFAESAREPGVLWVGSDDGLVHLSRDGGVNWLNVTPGDWPEMLISLIDPSPHDPATCYVAATRYKFDDHAPHLYKTTDWGRTWTCIADGIPDGHFTRAIRCDPARRGLLYAGTEGGVYASFDDGASWSPLQGNLPIVPIHDLVVRDHDLVAATHGRGFWILDDLTPLHAVDSGQKTVDSASVHSPQSTVHLFTPRTTVRWLGPGRRPQLDANQPRGFGSAGGLAVRVQQTQGADGERQVGFLDAGANPPSGVSILYYLPQAPEGQLKLRFLDASGQEIKSFTSKGADDGDKKEAGGHGGGDDPKPTAKPGINRFTWNARYPDAKNVPGTVMWAGSVTGPLAPPGRYTVELSVDGETRSASFDFVKDPRTAATQADLDAQFALLRQITAKLSETHDAVLSIRSIRSQVDGWVERTKGSPAEEAIAAKAKALRDALTEIEDELTQSRSKAHEDPLNFPIKLNNKLAALAGVVASADAAPTQGAQGVFADLSGRVDLQLGQLREVLAAELADFNAAVRETDLPPVVVPPAQ